MTSVLTLPMTVDALGVSIAVRYASAGELPDGAKGFWRTTDESAGEVVLRPGLPPLRPVEGEKRAQRGHGETAEATSRSSLRKVQEIRGRSLSPHSRQVKAALTRTPPRRRPRP